MIKIKSVKNLITKFTHKDGTNFIEFFVLNDVLNVRKVDIRTNIEIFRHVCGKEYMKFFLYKNNIITKN